MGPVSRRRQLSSRVWGYLSAHVNESMPWDSVDHVVFDRPLERHLDVASRWQLFFEIYFEMRFCVDDGMGKAMA